MILLLGINLTGCSKPNEQAAFPISSTISPVVAKKLKELQNHVSKAYEAKGRKHLTRLAEIFESINECCDELQGKNKKPAPTAADWGNISTSQHEQIVRTVASLENNAEFCRDYARDMHYSHLELGWKAFVGEYRVLKNLIENLDAPDRM